MAYLGLDLGTTGVKAALFAENGGLLAVGLSEYRLSFPRPEIVELEPEQYWLSAKEAICEAAKKAKIDPNSIRSVGITGQAETLVLLDAEGRPVRKAIVWLDNRADEESKILLEKFGADPLFRLSGQTDMLPCWPAPKILWVKRHEPEVFARTAKFLMVEDYIAWRLTGEFGTCRGLMPSSLYYQIGSGEYFQPMLDAIGISVAQLPKLFHPGEPLGVCRENDSILKAGTVVSIAPIDHVCGNLGSGCAENGIISETTGCTLALCATFERSVYDEKRRISTYLGFRKNSYALLPWAPTAGMLLKHFRDEFCDGMNFRQFDDAASQIAPGSEGLILLPHCAGAISPVCCPNARGVAFGITLAHKRAHWARAIMESVAYLLADNVAVLRETGCHVAELRSLGGGAKSRLWLQIKADVLNLPVTVTQCEEATALGAAILGAVAAGDFSDATCAAAKMVTPAWTVEPSSNAASYGEILEKYRQLNTLILPTFERKS
ncbi:MAG: FGGY family carbohydrate kinase [Victivallaceae bacterium]|nr:FGGY family carbohydrate kinase [Victivallaceae bacterium]